MALPYLHSFNNSTANGNLFFADTSFVWESFGTKDGGIPTRQQECHNFSSDAVKNGSVFVISPIVNHELRNIAVRELVKSHAPSLGLMPKQRKKVISNVPNLMALANSQVDQIMSILAADPSYVILEEDAPQASSYNISSKYNMDTNDSIILATMFFNEIDSIATLDGDYIEVHDKNLQIYTNHLNFLKIIRESPNKIGNSNLNNGATGTGSP
jgi:predicted nucleic acid-binding protein